MILEWFYLNRKTYTNKQYKITRGKQKKTIELVHNSALSTEKYKRYINIFNLI